MADIANCKIQGFRSTETKQGLETTVTYVVDMDTPTVSQEVIQKSQNAHGQGDIVQRIGHTFDVTVDGVQHVDAAIEADTITAEQRQSGPQGRRFWLLKVVYRNPSLLGFGGDAASPDSNKHPLERDDDFETESITVSVPRDFGRNQSEIKWPFRQNPGLTGSAPAVREIGEFGPVTNAAGFRYGAIPTKQIRLPIFVRKVRTTSPFAWIHIYQGWRDKRNDKQWDIFGQGRKVDAGTCAFYDVEPSTQKFWGAVKYWDLRIKVLYNEDGHDILQRNEGDKYWVAVQSTDEAPENQDGPQLPKIRYELNVPVLGGRPAPPPFILDDVGGLAENQEGIADLIRFEDLFDADFDVLNGALGA